MIVDHRGRIPTTSADEARLLTQEARAAQADRHPDMATLMYAIREAANAGRGSCKVRLSRPAQADERRALLARLRGLDYRVEVEDLPGASGHLTEFTVSWE